LESGGKTPTDTKTSVAQPFVAADEILDFIGHRLHLQCEIDSVFWRTNANSLQAKQIFLQVLFAQDALVGFEHNQL
jgi:hypothetical protein